MGGTEATAEAAGHAAGAVGEAEGAPGAHIRTVVINIKLIAFKYTEIC